MPGYDDGQSSAYEHFGIPTPPHKKKGLLERALPAITGLGAGALAYGFLRKPQYSNVAAFKGMQERANLHGFHRVADLEDVPIEGGVLGHLNRLITPTPDKETGILSPWNRFLLRMREGSGAIPVGSEKRPDGTRQQWIALPGYGKANPNKPYDVGQGVVSGRRETASYVKDRPISDIVTGGVDVEGDAATRKELVDLAHKKQKGWEGEMLYKNLGPEAAPETLNDLTKFHAQIRGKNRYKAVAELQELLKKHFGNDKFVLKGQQTIQSGGKFPWSDRDWTKDLKTYDRLYRKDKDFRKLIDTKGHEDTAIPDIKGWGALPGHTLNRFLKDPRSAFVQRAVPNPIGEMRVHTFQGAAPTQMMLNRQSMHGSNGVIDLKGVNKAELQRFVENAMQKLPEKYRNGAFGLDVIPHRMPDGSIGHKIIELNPHEEFTPGVTEGGGSGLLLTSHYPFMGQRHYRAATGRYDVPVAALGAVGAGVGGAALGHLATDDDQN